MRSNLLFYFALAINAISLYVLIGNIATLQTPIQNLDGSLSNRTLGDDMPAMGRMITWLLPLCLTALVALAFGLRAKGKLLAANLLVAVPALPMLAMIVFWVGFALLFILFGN